MMLRCKDGDMGTYQDCGNEPCCSEYCQCFLGTAWNYTCAPNIWDNEAKACKEPWEVPACGVTTEPPTEPPPSTPKSNECGDKWNPCPKDENGNDNSDPDEDTNGSDEILTFISSLVFTGLGFSLVGVSCNNNDR